VTEHGMERIPVVDACRVDSYDHRIPGLDSVPQELNAAATSSHEPSGFECFTIQN